MVFTLLLAGGLLWNFTRPAQYRVTATVLIEVPEGIGFTAGTAGADPQNVAVQGRILLAQDILADTLTRAVSTDPGPVWTRMACAGAWTSSRPPVLTWSN